MRRYFDACCFLSVGILFGVLLMVGCDTKSSAQTPAPIPPPNPWEQIYYNGDSYLISATYRMRVADGWIYRQDVCSKGTGTSLVFVPDPK